MEGKWMGFKEGEAVGALVRLDDSLKAGRGKIAMETTGRARLLWIRGEEEAGWRKGKLTSGPGLSAEDRRGRENGSAREDGLKGKRVGGGELGLQGKRKGVKGFGGFVFFQTLFRNLFKL
jgi:hypothetical protein